MSRSRIKVDVRAEEAPPSALMETVYAIATCFCAFVIGVFIALGWAV